MENIEAVAKKVLELDETGTEEPWESEYDGDSYSFHGGVIRIDTCYEEHTADKDLIGYYRSAAPKLAQAYLDTRREYQRVEQLCLSAMAAAMILDSESGAVSRDADAIANAREVLKQGLAQMESSK